LWLRRSRVRAPSVTLLVVREAVPLGEIVDQAALHGVLAKVRDLELPLIAAT
jgi:hypothetical protein